MNMGRQIRLRISMRLNGFKFNITRMICSQICKEPRMPSVAFYFIEVWTIFSIPSSSIGLININKDILPWDIRCMKQFYLYSNLHTRFIFINDLNFLRNRMFPNQITESSLRFDAVETFITQNTANAGTRI